MLASMERGRKTDLALAFLRFSLSLPMALAAEAQEKESPDRLLLAGMGDSRMPMAMMRSARPKLVPCSVRNAATCQTVVVAR